jgi:hypothetical protein
MKQSNENDRGYGPNTQLNGIRNTYNAKVNNFSMLGSSKKSIWDGRRRYRAI